MNEKKKSSKDSDDSPLDYIKINQKNIIEELTSKDYIAVTSNLLKSLIFCSTGNIAAGGGGANI